MTETQALLEAQRIAVIGTVSAALIGGLIGFLGSWFASHLAIRSERRRQLLQLGYEMGLKKFEKLHELADKDVQRGKTVKIFSSPFIYVYRDIRIMELIERGKLTPETLAKIKQETQELIIALKKIDENIS